MKKGGNQNRRAEKKTSGKRMQERRHNDQEIHMRAAVRTEIVIVVAIVGFILGLFKLGFFKIRFARWSYT